MIRWGCLFFSAVISMGVAFSAWAGPQEDLMEAVRTGNSAAVIAAVEKGADANAVLDYGTYKTRVLPWAARFSNLKLIRLLLDKGTDVNGVSPADDYSAVMNAAEFNQLETLKLLGAHKANLDYQVGNANALTLAVSKGHTTVVQWLIDQGIAFVNSDDESPLHAAISGGHTASLEALLKNHQRLKITPEILNQALDLTASSGSTEHLQLFLVHLNLLECLQDNDFGPALLAQAANGHNMANVKWLLERSVNPDIPDANGLTPLQILAESDIKSEVAPIIEYLLAHGANASKYSPEKLMVLERNHPDVPAMLFEKALANVSLTTRNAAGQTLLHRSVAAWSPGLTTFLVKRGVPLEAVDNSGNTPLLAILSQNQIADYGGYDQITEVAEADTAQFNRIMAVLLSHKPNLNAVNKKGQTILHVLLDGYSTTGFMPEKGMNGEVRNAVLLEYVNLLLQKGASLSVGKPPLQDTIVAWLIANGAADNDLLQTLLVKGATVNLKNPRCFELLPRLFDDSSEKGKALIVPLLEQLVSKGIPLNVGRKSPVLWAALSSHHPTALHWLLKKGANVNAVYESDHDLSYTAVHEAVFQDNPELLKILLLYKPKLDVKTASGKTALTMAEDNGQGDMAKLLKAAGAKP